MTGWIILGVIVLIIVGINMIRVGADLSYEDGIFTLSAKVAGLMLQLLPKQDEGENKPKKEKKPKKKKPKKEKPEDETKDGEKSGKKGLPLGMNKEELFELLKTVLTRLGRFPRKIRIDSFKLHVLVAGADPYRTAMGYGYLNECLSILLPLARNTFVVKESDVRTDVDFTTDELDAEAALGFSLRIGQIVGLILVIAFAGARIVIKSKLRQKKEAKAAAKSAPPRDTEEKQEEEKHSDKDIMPNERTESNGD